MSNPLFQLKNSLVLGLAAWLSNLSLYGKDSRERSKFVQLLGEHLQTVEKDRKELIGKYVNKDEKGLFKTVKIEDSEKYDIPEDKLGEFEAEYALLMNDVFSLDILEGNKEKFKIVREIVLNSDYKFGPKEGDSDKEREAKIRQEHDYVQWCDAFEGVTL